MKHILKLTLCAAFVALPITSCTTAQQKTAITIAEQTVNDLSEAHKIDAKLADQIKTGLDVASRFDLSKADAETMIANARLAVSVAQAAGAITPDQALAIRAGLNLAQLLFNQKAAQRDHDSEFPKLSAIAAAAQPPTPEPRLTMILTRREVAQIRRADWLTIARVTDPTSA